MSEFDYYKFWVKGEPPTHTSGGQKIVSCTRNSIHSDMPISAMTEDGVVRDYTKEGFYFRSKTPCLYDLEHRPTKNTLAITRDHRQLHPIPEDRYHRENKTFQTERNFWLNSGFGSFRCPNCGSRVSVTDVYHFRQC